MEIVNLPIDQVFPYEKNPRRNGKAIEGVANSIKEFGFKVPLVLDKNHVIVTGHTRYAAAQRLGLHVVPCVIAADLTDKQIKAFRLADNKVAEKSEWDYDLLNEEMQELEEFRMEDFGFIFEDFQEEINERIRTDSAYNLMDFEEKRSDGYYQMPMLAPVDFVPTRLIGFNYALNAKDKDYGIHFYVDDYQFERIWNNPARYVDVLREYQCILSPDFSLYMDMPMAMKIWNVYRSRLIGQIMQDAGIIVIPTISWAEPATFDWCFDGVARHSTVSVSTVGVKRNGLETFRVGIGAMLDRLEPSRILLYGGNVDVDWRGVEIVEYKNEVTERMKGADKSRNGV